MENGQSFLLNDCICKKEQGLLDSPCDRPLEVCLAIAPDECTACGTCADERCQVNAIEEGEDVYEVVKERCIGCGLCVTTCPSEAIKLIRKEPEELVPPPKDEMAWYQERARMRGVDISAYT